MTRVILIADQSMRAERVSRARNLWRLMGRILDKYEEGLSQYQTAAALGLSREKVKRLWRRLEISPGPGRRTT